MEKIWFRAYVQQSIYVHAKSTQVHSARRWKVSKVEKVFMLKELYSDKSNESAGNEHVSR